MSSLLTCFAHLLLLSSYWHLFDSATTAATSNTENIFILNFDPNFLLVVTWHFTSILNHFESFTIFYSESRDWNVRWHHRQEITSPVDLSTTVSHWCSIHVSSLLGTAHKLYACDKWLKTAHRGILSWKSCYQFHTSSLHNSCLACTILKLFSIFQSSIRWILDFDSLGRLRPKWRHHLMQRPWFSIRLLLTLSIFQHFNVIDAFPLDSGKMTILAARGRAKADITSTFNSSNLYWYGWLQPFSSISHCSKVDQPFQFPVLNAQ